MELLLGKGSVAKGSSSSSKLPKYSSSSRGPLDRSKRPWFIALLVAVKVCFSLSIFLLDDFLHQRSRHRRHHGGLFGSCGPLLQTIAFIQILSGTVYIFVQKPLSNVKKPPIAPWHWVRIIRHATILLGCNLTWIYALVLSGPFRTVLLSAHYNYTLAGILSGFFVAKFGARLRGGVLFVAGILVLLLFDDKIDDNSHGPPTPSTYRTEEQPFLSTNSMGIMTLVFYLIVKLGFDAMSKSLAVDLGGSKRLHALSTLFSGVIALFLSLIDGFTGGTSIPAWSYCITLIFIVLFGFIFNFYVDTICLKRMDAWQIARIGTAGSHISALVYSLAWITAKEVPNVATLIAFALICLGTWCLTTSERASGGGTLIGFSIDGLPLFNFSTHFSGTDKIPFWRNLLILGLSFYKQILEDRMSRRIFYYFILTVGFTSVEFLYGAITNSLGLISDGFHMLFDSMAIFIGLCASVVCRWKPTPSFPFGYGRVEVLSGFLNAFFLLVVAGGIAMEAMSRLLSPPSVDAHQTLTISIIGLCVNLIGIYVFRNGQLEHTHVHDNANIRGVFLHVLADTMGSVGVIVSSLLIAHFDLLIADPLCSLVIAAMIVLSAWPLLKDTGSILLLTVPSGLERNLQQVVLQLLAAEGVTGYRTLRFWTHAPQILTGSIHITATLDANEQQIIRHVNNLFSSIGFGHFTTQVEKEQFISTRNQDYNYEDNQQAHSTDSISSTHLEGGGDGVGVDKVTVVS